LTEKGFEVIQKGFNCNKARERKKNQKPKKILPLQHGIMLWRVTNRRMSNKLTKSGT